MAQQFFFGSSSFASNDVTMEDNTADYNGVLANLLTAKEIDRAIVGMEQTGKVIELNDAHKHKLCLYKPNKPNGYAQVDVNRYLEHTAHPLSGKKVLVHHIYWRATNNYQLIAPWLHVSHLTSNASLVSCTVLETAMENESRKYCKSLHWREDGRCPHRPIPCCPLYSIDPEYQ